MNEKDFNDIEVPVELAKEIASLRTKQKVYTWLLTGIVGIALIGGAWLYTHQDTAVAGNNAFTPKTNATQTGNVANAYYAKNNVNTNASNGIGSAAGGGCCGGGSGSTGGASREQLTSLEKQALADFSTRFGTQKVTAKAADYGCHIQIDIYDTSNKVIHSYAYRGNQLNLIQ